MRKCNKKDDAGQLDVSRSLQEYAFDCIQSMMNKRVKVQVLHPDEAKRFRDTFEQARIFYDHEGYFNEMEFFQESTNLGFIRSMEFTHYAAHGILGIINLPGLHNVYFYAMSGVEACMKELLEIRKQLTERNWDRVFGFKAHKGDSIIRQIDKVATSKLSKLLH